jgi:hypothetical protein
MTKVEVETFEQITVLKRSPLSSDETTRIKPQQLDDSIADTFGWVDHNPDTKVQLRSTEP